MFYKSKKGTISTKTCSTFQLQTFSRVWPFGNVRLASACTHGVERMSTSTPDTPLVANYDNNNEANATKMKQQMQKGTGGPTITGAEVRRSSASSSKGGGPGRTSRGCSRAHLNSLWSVWYGFFGTFLQAYTAVKCTKRFLSK